MTQEMDDCAYAIEYRNYCCQQHHPPIGSRTDNGKFSQIHCKQIEAIWIFTHSVYSMQIVFVTVFIQLDDDHAKNAWK